MASSSPASEVDEICRYILKPQSEEPSLCPGRRQILEGTEREAADDWVDEDDHLIIEFPHPDLDTGTKKKKTSGVRPPTLTTASGTSDRRRRLLFVGPEMAPSNVFRSGSTPPSGSLPLGRQSTPSTLLPISFRGGYAPHSGSKRKVSSGAAGNVLPKFKIIRRAVQTCKDLPTLSHEDINFELPPLGDLFYAAPTPADSNPPHVSASPFQCVSSPYHPGQWRPKAESPDSSGYRNVRVAVLGPEREERVSSSCKVVSKSVFVKPRHWFRLQYVSEDLANTETRVFAHYTRSEAGLTRLESCEQDYNRHKMDCNVCASRNTSDRPFLCSNNENFPVHPLAPLEAVDEDEVPFTPLNAFVTSAEPNKVVLQMTAICLNSCAHHKKRAVTLLVETRQRLNTTASSSVDRIQFSIRCCQAPTRDCKPKRPKTRGAHPNNPPMTPASTFSSPPQYPAGQSPDAPPSACLSPGLMDDSPMLSSAASPPYSISQETRHGDLNDIPPLQGQFKTELPMLFTNSFLQVLPGANDDRQIVSANSTPSGSKLFLEVPADDLDTLQRYRQILYDNNIPVLPGYKQQMY